MFAGLWSLLCISAEVNPLWWGLSQAACSACFLDVPHFAAPFQLWTGPTLFCFGLAIFLNQTSAWTFLEMQHQSWHCPWGDGKSFPHLMDVLLGLIPPRQELEATCLCPPSGWCRRDLFYSSACSFVYSCMRIWQQCLCTPQPFTRCQVWEGQHRLSVPSVTFQPVI